MKSLLIAFISIGFCAPMLSQSSDEHLRLQVLNYNMKEQNFIFGEWKKENGSETHLNQQQRKLQNYDVLLDLGYYPKSY